MDNESRKGDWQQTYTGRQFWPLDPRVEDICVEDIAHALSMQCRFGGHCRVFYSVAEHSVRVTDAPRLVLMRYLMTDDPTPWQMCVDINDDDSVVLGKDRATPSEALASVREHLDSASELPPVRWGDYGTMDGDAGLFGDGEDDDA